MIDDDCGGGYISDIGEDNINLTILMWFIFISHELLVFSFHKHSKIVVRTKSHLKATLQ
jgi:hypothetical protein